MNELHHCYGSSTIFNKDTCLDDNCCFYYACSIRCGNTIEMFEYELAGLLVNKISKKELLHILMINYDISYNAAKQAVKRWKLKSKG